MSEVKIIDAWYVTDVRDDEGVRVWIDEGEPGFHPEAHNNGAPFVEVPVSDRSPGVYVIAMEIEVEVE
jgi:hypothetical protein